MLKIKYIFLKMVLFLLNQITKLLPLRVCKIIKSNIWYKTECIRYQNKGVTFGDGTMIYNCTFSSSFQGDKFYIGKNCTLTGSTFLGHDASPTLFLKELNVHSKPWLPGARKSFRNPIYIGNNVFVGYGSILMPGVKIGDNVIIAAGSVVTKNLNANAVYAGNPAKFLKSIEDYTDKYKEVYLNSPDSF
jgi:acetyltransferase-like isoleucine patch superfamily enzyme